MISWRLCSCTISILTEQADPTVVSYSVSTACLYSVVFQIQTVKMLRNEWVENADRWVAGFLEIFEEGCHKMVSKIGEDTINQQHIR